MRKGLGLALLAAALCLLLTGCGGQKGGADTGASAPAESAQEGGPTSAREPATPEDAGDEDDGAAEGFDGAADPTEETETPAYADNLEVNAQAAANFARQLQQVTADKGLEALADLTFSWSM